MEQDTHVFQGLRRDTHPLRQDAKFLWDARNIRVTNHEDNTLLSLTNEKGTAHLLSLNVGDMYVGHCVLGPLLILFVNNIISHASKIYRLENIDGEVTVCTLFDSKDIAGYDGWTSESPIEAIGVYETELIQKVYWVDGKHQPRVINVTQPELTYSREEVVEKIKSQNKYDFTEVYNFNKYSFNFVSDLSLKEKVEIERTEGGNFDAGTIQYAFTYYNKYHQETNIFYTSPLQYISFNDRGASSEETTTNAFSITIHNIDNSFNYLRIYSIHRTSINKEPTVKLVTDIDISNTTTVNYVDTGTNGSIVDPYFLFYVGGEAIIANTLTSKDNTLFLGNIQYIKESIPSDIKDKLRLDENSTAINTVFNTKVLKYFSNNSYYNHSNQLNLGDTSGFKVGEVYRMGLQFQYKNGKWSEPVFIKDFTVSSSLHPYIDYSNETKLNTIALEYNTEELKDYVGTLKKKGYIKVRGLIVYPSIYDRNIIAQGIICPTLFNAKDRNNNSPFAQSSWFFRPMSIINRNIVYPHKDDNNNNVEEGAKIPFKHLHSLYGYDNRGAEIQNMREQLITNINTAVINNYDNYNTVFIDQSILTFHSPEIEFNDNIQEAIKDKSFNINIVGLTRFKSNMGDISIVTSSPELTSLSYSHGGFYHKNILSDNYSNRALISGLFYKSNAIVEGRKDNKVTIEIGENNYNWLIYPWHRSGSLNNDTSRTSYEGTRSAVLERKVISNLRYSDNNIWLDTPVEYNHTELSPISVFNSNEISLVKLPSTSNKLKSINYYGNVDTLITTDTPYSFHVTRTYSQADTGFSNIPKTLQKENNKGTTFLHSTDPVRIKYKSTPHAVFAFNFLDNNTTYNILPYLQFKDDKEVNKLEEGFKNLSLFWNNAKGTADNTKINEKKYLTGFSESSTMEEIYSTCISALTEEFSDEATVGDLCISNSALHPTDRTYVQVYEFAGKSGSSEAKEWDIIQKVYSLITYHNGTDVEYYKPLLDNTEEGYYYNIEYTRVPEEDIKKNYKDTTAVQKEIYIDSNSDDVLPVLYLAEIRRNIDPINRFGGNTEEALKNNLWLPASESILLDDIKETEGKYPKLKYIYGDTWYQRYDCLKTYPFTQEDENSVVEIGSFLCETHINIDGRCDKNRGQLSNLYATPNNFNKFNEVYSQSNNFFNYRLLDKDFYRTSIYNSQVLWSKNKALGEDTDTWTNVTLANTLDMNSNGGNITALRVFNDTLLCFQEKSLSKINFNSRVQINTSDGVPIEISNNNKVDGYLPLSNIIGCFNKWSIVTTPQGIYFIDANTKSLYLYNEQLLNVTTERGMSWWIKEFNPYLQWSPNKKTINGVRSFYDESKGDVYFVPGPVEENQQDALCYSEKLQQFTSFMSYGGSNAMINFNNCFNIIKQDKKGTHSIYIMNEGEYNKFFDNKDSIPYSISFVSNALPVATKVFDTIEMRVDITDSDSLKAYNNKMPFNYITAYNEYQYGEDALINNRNMKKRFRIWRCNIPRDTQIADGLYGTDNDKTTVFGKARMRNPWVNITLANNDKNDTSRFILHDLAVNYSL